MEKRKNNNIDISLILASGLSGELNTEERYQLDVWLAASEKNESLWNELQLKKNRKKREELISRINMEQEWNRFESRTRTQTKSIAFNWKRWTAYAAAVIVPFFLLSIFLINNFKPKEEIAMQVAPIKPGVKKAQLLLSTGELVELGDTTKYDLRDQGMNIHLADQKLDYKDAYSVGQDLRQVYNELIIGRGEEYHLILADGTEVWLNSETKLRYPVRFKDDVREVELEGEACFKVSHNAEHPFYVKNKDIRIEVLGTTFNVCAYPDEENIVTTLVEGAIMARSTIDRGMTQLMKPNEQLSVDKIDHQFSVKQVDAGIYTEWTKGMFAFEEKNLEYIMRRLERWYNVEVFFRDQEAREKLFSGKLPRFNTCNELLAIIEKTTNLEIHIQEDGYIIIGLKK